jgi:NAD(P)H-hydrate epimerase
MELDIQDHPFPIYKGVLPKITTEQMIEVDRLMIEEYHIELIQMMENAGRALALLAKEKFLGDDEGAKHVIVLVGTGGNGGGALVAARRLSAWGYDVSIFLSNPDRMKAVPQHQLDILKAMGVSIEPLNMLPAISQTSLIIDGIIGYSVKGAPRGAVKTMIEWANSQNTPVLSLDTPSGVDLTTGQAHEPSVQADATMTLALPKRGLYTEDVKGLRGELYLADISVPTSLYSRPSLNINVETPFLESDIVRID